MKITKKLIAGALSALMLASIVPFSASAKAKAGDEVMSSVSSRVLGTYQEDGSILFKMQEDAHANGNALWELLSSDKKKTIVLPKKKIKIDRVLYVGNNTTLIATGATIFQTDWQKTLIIHDCDKTNYNSLKNVTIKGGTWQIKDNAKARRSTSSFRFNHAQNINIIGCKIETNHISHAIELIACKNVTVDKCTLTAKGKTKSDSLEEALQIDIATKATAPSCAAYGNKYVKGQTCKNITVKNCKITGSRGICANKTDTEGGKWLKNHHENIKITGNTLTGVTSEALALHNVAGATVKNNTITSKGSRTGTVYTIGLNLCSFGYNNVTSKHKITIEGNTIKGGLRGLYINTASSNKFGKTTIKNNKLYAKSGTANAMVVSKCTSVTKKNNKLYKW